MAFENLTRRLQNVFTSVKRKNHRRRYPEAAKEIRLALLEADVAPVVKDFIKVRERAIGHESH